MVGALAGFFGSWTDQGLMRFTDLFLVVPELAILAVALEYSGHTGLVIILVLARAVLDAASRASCAVRCCRIREKEFVEAARAAGASPKRIIVRHIVPNIIGPIMVNVTLAVDRGDHHRVDAVVPGLRRAAAADLVGPDALRRRGLRRDVEVVPDLRDPGSRSCSPCSCVNFIGDGLRDAFDPQSEKH